ncbi:MAG TPA: hypothetical protein ENJ42_09150 [Hellea balneolensis]|uniref:DUF3667 domain-containing protein n=1 Tax=Hellea balneolensis TaxID=287478 RepID=A0A7C5M0T9_9PROT|nr:hypothetical protein [Hellea balneolensis]
MIEKWLKGNNGFYFDVDENTVNTGMGTNTAETKSEKTSDTGNSSEVDELKKPLAQVKNDVLTELTPEQKEKLKIAQEQARDVTDRLSPNRMSKLFLQIVRNPGLVNGIIYKWLPRIMFLMMPITMFIGILFIRGRGNALLYDHLVHAAYIHSVAFFLLFLGVLLMYILPGALVAKTLMVILLIYLPLSLRGMFHRGWIKSIWASYGVGFIYLLIVSTVATGIVSYQVWKLAETIV